MSTSSHRHRRSRRLTAALAVGAAALLTVSAPGIAAPAPHAPSGPPTGRATTRIVEPQARPRGARPARTHRSARLKAHTAADAFSDLTLRPGVAAMGAVNCNSGVTEAFAEGGMWNTAVHPYTTVEVPMLRGFDYTAGEDARLVWFQNRYFTWDAAHAQWASSATSDWYSTYSSDRRSGRLWKSSRTGAILSVDDYAYLSRTKAYWAQGTAQRVAQYVAWTNPDGSVAASVYQWLPHSSGNGYCSF
jgi:hypothetical protein